MKERPILFSGAMVRALLAGEKTQTRRVVKPQPPAATVSVQTYHHPDPRAHFWASGRASLLDWAIPCPYGEPGDRLYVRETFVKIIGQSGGWIETDYQATYRHGDRLGDTLGIRKKWTPSIHMPREASRILLEITGVRVERLNSISEADARAEGITDGGCTEGGNPETCGCTTPIPDARDAFIRLWTSINGTDSWAANPWVWVVEFKRAEKSVEADICRNGA